MVNEAIWSPVSSIYVSSLDANMPCYYVVRNLDFFLFIFHIKVSLVSLETSLPGFQAELTSWMWVCSWTTRGDRGISSRWRKVSAINPRGSEVKNKICASCGDDERGSITGRRTHGYDIAYMAPVDTHTWQTKCEVLWCNKDNKLSCLSRELDGIINTMLT